jgi:L-2-hydroxyglutarate oxidase
MSSPGYAAGLMTRTSTDADIVVVGGGIVGLATAWTVLQRRPDAAVVVVEKESAIGVHQTGHNSGVLHAGIYYAPGSLKARLCRDGKQQIERYARDRGIPFDTNGKLVIAADDDEVPRLERLAERAERNGVPGLRWVDATGLQQIEPAAQGVAALHSPSTGVIDFRAVCDALAEDVRAAGGVVRTDWAVEHLSGDGPVVVAGPAGRISARRVIACAGLQSDRLAGTQDVRIVPFRGSWYRLRPPVADRIRGNIYPVPDPRYPFLGVHLTRRIDGEVWAGPNAFLALARERYRRWAIAPRDAVDVARFGGFWRFAARNLPTARRELVHDLSRHAYARAVARYVPGVRAADLERGPMGVRAQAMTSDGSMVDDFRIERRGGVVHVLNAPSPAATSALAIAETLVDRALAHEASGGIDQ